MTLKPFSRPRGRFRRPYQRSVNLAVLELVLLQRFADREGLALGAAIRELAIRGLLFHADENPSADPFTRALANQYFGEPVDERLSASDIHL